jgi:hypothetical protein
MMSLMLTAASVNAIVMCCGTVAAISVSENTPQGSVVQGPVARHFALVDDSTTGGSARHRKQATGVCAADLSRDGLVSTDDLLAVLGAFGHPCDDVDHSAEGEEHSETIVRRPIDNIEDHTNSEQHVPAAEAAPAPAPTAEAASQQFEMFELAASRDPATQMVSVASQINFAADIETIPEGSSMRVEFEQRFGYSIAGSLGDGETIRPDTVFVDDISEAEAMEATMFGGARPPPPGPLDPIQPPAVRVLFHISIPYGLQSTMVSLIETLQASAEMLEVVVAGVTLIGNAETLVPPIWISMRDQCEFATGVNATGRSVVPPPPGPRSSALPSEASEGTLPCSNSNEFEVAFAPVVAECCDEPSEDCSTGFPVACNAGCAAVLLPAQAACEDFLTANGMLMAGTKALIDNAAALCPLPCRNNGEFEAVFRPASVECCDEPSEDCSTGFPVVCNAECAAVLLPAQDACEDFLAAGGMLMAGTKGLIDNAVARCPSRGDVTVVDTSGPCHGESLQLTSPPAAIPSPVFEVTSGPCTVSPGGECVRSPNYPNIYRGRDSCVIGVSGR